jgi:hypothetical protein
MIDSITVQVHVPAGCDPADEDVRALALDAARQVAADNSATIVGTLEFVGVTDSGASNWKVPAHRPEARI